MNKSQLHYRGKSLGYRPVDDSFCPTAVMEAPPEPLRTPRAPADYFRLAQMAATEGCYAEAHAWWRRTLACAKLLGTATEWKRRALTDTVLKQMWNAPGVFWPEREANG